MTPGPLAHPEWIRWIVLALTAAATVLVVSRLLAGARLRRWLGSRARLASAGRRRDLLLLLALAAVGIALLGPIRGTRTVRVPASGVDVVVLIDVSRSMEVADVAPSRLARARRVADRVLGELDAADRVALAAFAGTGVLLTPLTPDREALRSLLPALDPTLLDRPGSNLEAGIESALGAFASESARPRSLLVLTDGEDPGGDRGPETAALVDGAVRAIAVALGTESGGAVPDGRVALRDARGQVVRSRREAGRLERWLEPAGGAVIRADAWGEVDLPALVGELRRDAAGARDGWIERPVPRVRIEPFVLLAIALLLGEAFPLSLRLRRPALRTAAVALIALLPVALQPAEARDESLPDADRDAATLLERGLERASRGELREAERAFFAAAASTEDRELAADALFDLGVAAIDRGDYERARRAFFDVLTLAPDDFQARANLEWTLRAMREREAASDEEDEQTQPDDGSEREDEPRAEDVDPLRPLRAPPEPQKPEPERAEPLELSESAAERWLEEVQDDPLRALQARIDREGEGVRSPGPLW